MKSPDYQRPFEPKDFRGYFKWTKVMSKKLKNNFLYHACHKDELEDIINGNELTLRSSWSIKLPEHGFCEIPGVWSGLNYFVNGNFYGPFVIKFPLSVLEGKQFIAFLRGARAERNRYFFVQYDAMIPIYSFKGNIWRRVNSDVYFDEDDGKTLQLKPGAIYDIVLTSTVPFSAAMSLSGEKHNKCIPGKCDGLSVVRSRKIMRRIAKGILKKNIIDLGVIKNFINKYPDIEGETIEIEIK